MKVLTANITINNIQFNRISSVKIESSWDMLTDTAEVVIPRALYFGNKILKDNIKVGYTIIIELGYNGILNEEFRGYITKITTDAPIILKCEDNMWKLKQIPVNHIYKSINLQELLNDIIPRQYNIDSADIMLGNIIAENTTVAGVLQMLKDDYSIYSYFKGNTLVSGKIYTDDDDLNVVYGFEKNIISHNLKYVNSEDIKIKVTAECIKNDGEKITVTVGDDDGIENKLIYSGIENEADLKVLAEQDLERLKIDGYEGDITTFGVPYVQHGYTAYLESKQYPERAGNYYVDAVNTEFSINGFRRTVKIGKQAS